MLHSEPQYYASYFAQSPKYGNEFFLDENSHLSFDNLNPDAPVGGDLTLAISQNFDNLNPFILFGICPRYYLDSLCFATLLYPSPDEIGVSYAFAAESVDVDLNNRRVTFVLQNALKFSDGSPITTEDVAWSYNFLKKSGLPHFKSIFADIDHLEVKNDRTIIFHLKSGTDREVVLHLGNIPIFSKNFMVDHANQNGLIRKPFPASGPYYVSEANFGQQLSLGRNNAWWGFKLPQFRGMFNFSKVILEVYRNQNAAYEAFIAGRLDLRLENQARRWARGYKENSNVARKYIKGIFPSDNLVVSRGMAFNLRRPKFQNHAVRKALSMLFTFKDLNVRSFYNQYHRLHTYFPNSPYAHHGKATQDELQILSKASRFSPLPKDCFNASFDPSYEMEGLSLRELRKKSLTLLNAAGWTIAPDGLLRDVDGNPFTIDFPFEFVGQSPILQHLKQNFSLVGVQLKLRFLDTSAFKNLLENFDFDMTFINEPHPQILGQSTVAIFSSAYANIPGSPNLMGLSDPAVDFLLSKLDNASTMEDLSSHAKALDRYLSFNDFMIMGWDYNFTRIAYWDHLDMPKDVSPYCFFSIMRWWQKTAPDHNAIELGIWQKLKNFFKGIL